MLIWTVLTLIFVITPFLSESLIRTVLGIPMVLFIPGYVLIAALFPKKDDLEGIERLALSFGLSIAVVPLLGLVLNFTVGIRLIPVLITLCLYTATLLVIAAYRREKLPENERFRVPFHRVYELVGEEFSAPRSKTDRILTGVLIFSIILAIGMIFFVITTPKIGERFTEFYILGPEGKADNYPSKLKIDNPVAVMVGVVNQEYAPVNYTIQIALDNNILTSTGISLNQNETWEHNMTFIPEKEGNDLKLEFRLFKESNFTAPYRDLHLWVNVTPSVNKTPLPSPVTEVLPTGKEIAIKVDNRRGFILHNRPDISGNIVHIDPGDKVVWFNNEAIMVTLVSDNKEFGSRLLGQGKRTSYIFIKSGTYYFSFKENKNANITIVVD
ncbi:MAG TPA: DUF1616 domain-containing protein [Candidatus Limnocylindrales bacterium]|nr:DUF1616 domain-containing protein [Candidatus Limnocylindrales bacterium]